MPERITVQADLILPITRDPIPGGTLVIEDGRVAAVLPEGDGELRLPGVILPGLVNAHAHLELSNLKGQVPAGVGMCEWIDHMLTRREETDVPVESAIADAVDELQRTGTAAIGEVANTGLSGAHLASSRLEGVVYAEVLGLEPDAIAEITAELDALEERLESALPRDRFRVRPAAHAPFSCHPDLIRIVAARSPFGEAGATSVHVAESPDEVEYLATKGGAFTELYARREIDASAWEAPGTTTVDYFDNLGLLREGALAIHVVEVSDDDIARLAARSVSAVVCPGSNRYIGLGRPDVRALIDAGLTVAIGTDSLASNVDLDLFRELRDAVRDHANVSPSEWLRIATLGGATALGLTGRLGEIAPSVSARLLWLEDRSVAESDDPVAALIASASPSTLRWLDEWIGGAR